MDTLEGPKARVKPPGCGLLRAVLVMSSRVLRCHRLHPCRTCSCHPSHIMHTAYRYPDTRFCTCRTLCAYAPLVPTEPLDAAQIYNYALALRSPWLPRTPTQHARAELERMSYSNYYFDRRDPRRPRFCKRCQAWKPERAHHCSVSGRCVLKMVRGHAWGRRGAKGSSRHEG